MMLRYHQRQRFVGPACLALLMMEASIIIQQVSSYSPSALKRLVQASSLSYLSLEQMSNSPYYLQSQLEPIVQVVDPITESGATVFVDKTNDNGGRQLIVACRGSANLKNFGTNLRFNLVPASTRLISQSTSSLPDDPLVHEGFQEASEGLWEQLGPQIMDILKKESDTTSSISDLVFTGHSLGAANALLCAVQYSSASTTTKKFTPSVITFAGPRLCNNVLAQYISTNSLKGSKIINLVHDKDPVLANNQQLWDQLGFEIVGQELKCNPNSPIVYGEGEEEQQLLPAWNILDHCNYMGVFVGPRL